MFNFAPEFFSMSYSEKQNQILLTAEKLFANKGYDGTSIRDIAEEAGINIAMISYYFGSKEKLMQALFEERTSHIKLRIESLLKNTELTPFQKIEVLINDHVQKAVERQQFYKVMLCEQLLNKNPEISKLLLELKKQNADYMAELIKEGQKKGEFKKNVDVVLTMNTMTGVIMQTLMNQEFYKYYNNTKTPSGKDFHESIKTNLTNHIKVLFKAILSYEA